MKLRKLSITILTFGLVSLLILSACASNNNNSTNTGGQNPVETAGKGEDNSASDNNGSDANGGTASAEPMAKYDPPINLSTSRSVDNTWKYVDGENLDNNVWTKGYLEELGINLTNDWSVASSQYDEKLNVAIASGDLPDVFDVNATQLKKLVDAGQLADLTSAWETNATEFAQNMVLEDGGHAMQSATFDGKLYAIPQTTGAVDTAHVLWIRTDWLTKLGLSEPQSMEDVLAIAEAFTTQDPDENGKKDTYGMAIHKNLWDGWAGLQGFFNAFHAYPNIWVKDQTTGQLVFGTVQPAMKTALVELQKLYKMGVIDPEFGVKDPNKEGELADKIGMFFGAQWAPISPLQAAKTQDPEMDWKAFPIMDMEGQLTNAQIKFPIIKYTVVRKGYEHPEALAKLASFFAEKIYGPNKETTKYLTTPDGIEVFKPALAQIRPALGGNQESQVKITAALENGDPSNLDEGLKATYDSILKFRNGDNSQWQWERVFGPVSSQNVLNQFVDQNLLQNNEFFGAPTETMGSKQSSLDKMTLEVLTKIIMGDASVEEFDNFTENWNKLGGSDITKEVNEWYAAQ
ncbi:extracellular solute-binding protein [Paenibacillus sp. HB172176]|uniref:extracellular solute-binding protein n=1 Tax=Paenibacillus sp. HB172176 TaxID=2493690 RepID=UPI0014391D50|nr:extracellular solute-binding protein [Paenibacillus sp. HB172176]